MEIKFFQGVFTTVLHARNILSITDDVVHRVSDFTKEKCYDLFSTPPGFVR